MFLFAEKKRGPLGQIGVALEEAPENSEIYNFSCFLVEKKRQVFDHAYGKNTGARICPLGHKKNHRDHREHRDHRAHRAHRDHKDHRDHRATLLLLFLRGQVGKLVWRLKRLPKPCILFTFFPKSTNGNVCCCDAWKGAWKLR